MGSPHGACGTVQEIIFDKDQNPNFGYQPKYVIVHFPQYIGPAWNSKNPKVCLTKQHSCITQLSENHTLTLDKDIPILTVSVSCKFKCCQRTFIPLELSFARTIHKFQGLQAGPIDPGRTPNVFKRIICNPDTKSAEARATGLLYTALSRATSLGDIDGRNSAIYFIGNDLSYERVIQLTYKTNTDTPLANVHRRSIWVQHLRSHLIYIQHQNLTYLQQIMTWASSTNISYDTLYVRIKNYTLAKNKKNYKYTKWITLTFYLIHYMTFGFAKHD